MKMVLAPHEISEDRISGILTGLKRPAVRYTKTTPEEAIAPTSVTKTTLKPTTFTSTLKTQNTCGWNGRTWASVSATMAACLSAAW